MESPPPARRGGEPVFDGQALPFALGGIAAAIVAARVISPALGQFSIPVAGQFLVFWTVVFGGLWLTCRSVSRRFGSGNPWADFGFRWRPSDLWRGALAYLVAQFLSGAAVAPWAGHTGRLNGLTERMIHVSPPAFLVYAVSGIVAAPIFEELAFRGMLQRTLADRVGGGRAVVGQAAAFGAYHLAPGLGRENVPYFLALVCFGLVMGWLARRLHRLGAGCTAHVLANGLITLSRASSR
jgi:membrane protease YdiL (CAAX protease family)